MSFLTVGDDITVTVKAIALADGVITLLVSDMHETEYTMQIGRNLPGRQEAPQPAPAAPEAARVAQVLACPQEEAPAAPEGPSKPAQRPRIYDQPEEIALWLADNPSDLRLYAVKLSLKKRTMIGSMLLDLLGESEDISSTIAKFTAPDPHPDFTGSQSMWGHEGSPIVSGLHEGQMNKILAQQATGHATISPGLMGVKVKPAKGNELTALQAWKELADKATQ